jgi:hypothetical protein
LLLKLSHPCAGRLDGWGIQLYPWRGLILLSGQNLIDRHDFSTPDRPHMR